MALEYRNIDVPFTKGVDRSQDEILAIPDKLQILKNMELSGDKLSCALRGGWRELVAGDTAYSGDNPIDATKARVFKRRREALLESSLGLHTADVDGAKWKQIKTTMNRAAVELEGAFHGPGRVIESDIAGTDDLKAIVYSSTHEKTASGQSAVYLRVVRKGVVIRDARIDTSTDNKAVSPRVVYDPTGSGGGPRFGIYWAQSDAAGATLTIRGTTLLTSNLGASLAVVTIKSDWTGTGQIDACFHDGPGSSNFFLAYPSSTTARSVQCLMLGTGAATTIDAQANSGTVFANPINAVSVCVTTDVVSTRDGYVAVVHSTNSADGLALVLADLENAAPAAAFTNIGNAPTGKIATLVDSFDSKHFWLAYEAGTPGVTTTVINAVCGKFTAFAPTFSTAAGFASTGIVRSVGIASGLHIRNRSVYVGAVHYSLTQSQHHEIEIGLSSASSHVAVTSLHDICSRLGFNGGFLFDSTFGGILDSPYLAYGSGATFPAQIPHATTGSATTFTLKQRGNGDRIVEATLDTTMLGIDITSLTWGAQINSVECGEALVLAGANPLLYDGQTLAELGFEQYPESTEITTSVALAGGGLPDGTYQFVCVFEWTDLQGNKHQSRPSTPVSIVIAGGGGLATLSITAVPTLRLTRKSNVIIAGYLTEANGSIFYRIPCGTAGLLSGQQNNASADTVGGFASATFGSSVTNLITGEQLYTTGGALSNSAYPACKHVASCQGRIWFCGGEEQQIRYTEERTIAFFPGTNEFYVFETDTSLGRCGLIEAMDDKLIVGQERQIGAIWGRGPNRLGQQNDFSPIMKVLGGNGVVWENTNCTALDADGLWFCDKAGLRHLNRSMQLSVAQDGVPIGAEVDTEVDTLIADAVVYAPKKQVRFVNNGAMLVWDYENHQWSVFTNDTDTPVKSATVTEDNVLVFLASNGYVLYESTTLYTDRNAGINIQINTAWLRVGALAGFQRLRAVHVLGSVAGSLFGPALSEITTFEIKVLHNYSVGLDQASSTTTVPDLSPFNSGSLDLDGAYPFQIDARPVTQKSEACMIQLKALCGEENTKLRISAISLQIGAKRGMFKTSSVQRAS